MPELPEVEAARQRLLRTATGRRITAVTSVPDTLVFADPPDRLARALRGRRIEGLGRRGKHLWLELDRRPWLLVHFGMTGSFEAAPDGAPRPPGFKLELRLDDGQRLFYADFRRFGRVRLREDPLTERPVADLGWDPLEGLPRADVMHARLQRRHAPLKAVLLDQSVFAGVGNWIADEVLYQARLAPKREASSLALTDVRRLRTVLHAVIRRAVSVEADSERFPRTWLFHVRWGRRAGSLTAAGEAIVHETVGGRTTAWVPGRQK